MGLKINETEATETNKSQQNATEDTSLELYIGIFFDGTNNNKFQVMLGKKFRWEEIFKKHRWDLTKHIKGWNVLEYSKVNMYSILEYPRSYWESGPGKGIFNKSELEFMYFGYGDINNSSSGWRSSFIEQKSQTTLEGNDENQLSSKPDNPKELEKLIDVANHFTNNEEGNNWIKDKWKGIPTDSEIKGAAAQNTTYTNVAILESLYKCENKSNVKEKKEGTTEKHLSIYIEGSGSDMQLEAATNYSHKLTKGLAGLGLGTGPSGVAGKVRKASMMVKRLLDQNLANDIKEINFHFDLFGFSRGSTCARTMAYVINPKNNIAISESDYKLFTFNKSMFLPPKYRDKKLTKTIRFMGLFDTVSSIGVIDEDGYAGLLATILDKAFVRAKNPEKKNIYEIWDSIEPYINPFLKDLGYAADYYLNTQVLDKMGEMLGYSMSFLVPTKLLPLIEKYKTHLKSFNTRDKGTEDLAVKPKGKGVFHKDNVKDYGLWATELAEDVVHICAMDEVRRNFALVDIQSSIDQNGTEIFIPGCHTDIGGGASIGMDDKKQLKKGADRFFPMYKIHSKAELEPINHVSVETLKELGWLDQGSSSVGKGAIEDQTYYIEKSNCIQLYRFVKPGYSNVSLNYIHHRAKNSFYSIPKSYDVPSELKSLLDKMEKLCIGKKRYFLYPENTKQYCELRRKYLHFSFNEQGLLSDFADNNLVNGPEYAELNPLEKVISRIIYPGSKDNSQQKHMFDYD